MAKKSTPPTKPAVKEKKEQSLIAENTKLTITIDAATAKSAYVQALKKLAKKLKHPGFRAGKVPPKIAEEILGQPTIIESALDVVLPQAYQTAVVAEKKQPLTRPSITPVTLELGKDWQLTAEIAERPNITLGDYKKIVRNAKKTAQKTLEEQVTQAQKTHEEKSKSSKKEKESSKNPKPATPPFQEPTAEQKRDFLLQSIYQTLVTELKPSIPELLVREEVRYDLDELARQLEPLKLSIQEYLQKRSITEQELSNELATRALGRLQITLLLQEIAKEADLKITEKAVDAAITETNNPEMIAQKQNPQYRNLIEQTLLRQSVAEHLLSL